MVSWHPVMPGFGQFVMMCVTSVTPHGFLIDVKSVIGIAIFVVPVMVVNLQIGRLWSITFLERRLPSKMVVKNDPKLYSFPFFFFFIFGNISMSSMRPFDSR